GTDGAIYVADWYDPVVGGHQMQDSTGYGRIYRITPKNKELTIPLIDLSTVRGQIEALKNPAINVRYLAFEKLRQQGDSVLQPVMDLLKNDNPYIKARAIWLMPQLGNKGLFATEQLLKSDNENNRLVAFRALRVAVPDILPYAVQLQNDPSSFIRREVAVAIRDLPFEKTKPILIELTKRYDGEDKWYLNALAAAFAGHEEEIYPEMKMLFAPAETPGKWNIKMSSLAWALHPVGALNDLVQRASDSTVSANDRKQALAAIAFIKDKKAAEAMLTLSKSNSPAVKEQATYWLSFRQGNDWYALLDWKKISINTGYERKMSAMKSKLRAVLDEHLSLDARKWRLEQMAMDSVGGQLLMGLAAENKFPVTLTTAMEEVIFKNPDIAVRVQAGKYFKQPGGKKNYSIQEIVKIQGNVADGKTVFNTYCTTCHRIGQAGNDIGPELTTIGKKFDKTGLLDAILNPSAAILLGYEPWLINTKDGSSYFGFLISENKQSVTIKDVSGQKHVIAADKISTRQKQDKSLMPEPAVTGISEQQLADIVAYLSSGK
ncbi:MAG: c-type cytochrome, partial [Bacteroidetes bacterium]|nr:c-type cytochrome [Bacteroidota bacterium]